MENEQRWLSWKDIDKRIVCPFPPADCRITEGVRRTTEQLSHSAALFTAECNSCEVKATVMGDPFNDCSE